jgi:hypothetical protein
MVNCYFYPLWSYVDLKYKNWGNSIFLKPSNSVNNKTWKRKWSHPWAHCIILSSTRRYHKYNEVSQWRSLASDVLPVPRDWSTRLKSPSSTSWCMGTTRILLLLFSVPFDRGKSAFILFQRPYHSKGDPFRLERRQQKYRREGDQMSHWADLHVQEAEEIRD